MAGLPNSSNALQQWHHLFEAEGTKRSPQAQQHLQQLLRTGLPTRKHENWKYTPLEGLTNSQFVSIAGEISPQQRDALALTLDAVRLVFVDGRYVSALSDATEGSGYEVSINDDRQGVPDAIQAEVFLHLTESPGTKRDAYRREARSTAGKAIAVNAYYPRAWQVKRSTLPITDIIWIWRKVPKQR